MQFIHLTYQLLREAHPGRERIHKPKFPMHLPGMNSTRLIQPLEKMEGNQRRKLNGAAMNLDVGGLEKVSTYIIVPDKVK